MSDNNIKKGGISVETAHIFPLIKKSIRICISILYSKLKKVSIIRNIPQLYYKKTTLNCILLKGELYENYI